MKNIFSYDSKSISPVSIMCGSMCISMPKMEHAEAVMMCI